MLIYIFIFIITAIIAYLQFDKKEKVSIYLFFSYVLAIGTFVGLGDMLGGYDRYIYCEVYTSISEDIRSGSSFWYSETFIRFFTKEPLYGLINVLIGHFSPNRYVFILTYTIIMYLIYGICFYKYTEKPFFALLIFLGLMFFFTFTYLRQVLAAGVVWLSLPYYAQRKTKAYLLTVAVATLIHNSAAIMALLYFIPLKKWNFGRIAFVMFILFGLGLIGVGELFSSMGELTGLDNISRHAHSAEVGFRFEYVLEALFFLFLLQHNYRKIRISSESLSYLNLYLAFCGILLFFCKSGDGGRIAWYGIMGIIIVLTHFCKLRTNDGLRLFVTTMMFALFFRTLSAWSFNMCPYKTFLTPGHTAEEWIYEQYEYDHYYDRDKFYNL